LHWGGGWLKAGGLEVTAGGMSTSLKFVGFELESGTATVTDNWPIPLVDSDLTITVHCGGILQMCPI
jgi:hypothetical protein